MNKVYKKLVVYCPTDNSVSWVERLPYEVAVDESASNDAFFHVWELVNRSREIVVGITLGGDCYQLSPASYGTYIKESWSSMRLINRPRMLCAISKYQEAHPSYLDD